MEASASTSSRLLVFDVEGVLIPEKRYLLLEALELLGLLGFFKVVVVGFLYEVGLLPLDAALRWIYGLFRGVSIDEMFRLFRKIPVVAGVEEVFKGLRNNGWKLALLSSGLPQVFVEDLALRLGADYAFGLSLRLKDDKLTGEVEGEILQKNGKALVLKELLKKEGITARECVVVVDDRNNICMFPLSWLRIGYNPDFLVRMKADFVVEGGLSKILPLVRNGAEPERSLSRNDFAREAIHMGSFSIPFVCRYLLDYRIVSSIISVVALLFFLSEFFKLRGRRAPLFSAITRVASTMEELNEFTTAPLFFALGVVTSLLLFPQPLGFASIAILTLGDGAATLFGGKWGRTRFPFNKGKTLEASAFGFLFAFAGACVFVGYVNALIGAFVGMFIECLPLPVDDNLTIPLTCGLVLSVLP
ncbi:MAG: haloacid dehalogenase-like hydrolase [Candidatus Freyarchaeota archaeon]